MTDNTENNTLTLYTFANHEPADELHGLLRMFYSAAFGNKIGIMQALNTETNKEEVVLVGIQEKEDDTTQVFPLALVLKAEDVNKYVAPDGEGGWATREQSDESED